MKVYVTYTYNEVIDVPDDATDNEIADICAKRHQEKIMTILDGRITKQNFSEKRSKIDSEAQSIVKAEQS